MTKSQNQIISNMKKIFFTFMILLSFLLTKAQDNTYVEEEVSYWNSIDSIKIGGTLTIPKKQGKFPAVLLITGSGQQDRDETLMGHKPFKVIAEYLSEKGIAVLRVDDRGKGKSTGKFSKSTGSDFVKDVLAGIEFLKNRDEINPTKIGLLGHSEGGSLAPEVAVKSENVAFIVSLAGTAVNGLDLLIKQNYELQKSIKSDTVLLSQYLTHFYRPTMEEITKNNDTKTIIKNTMLHMSNFRKLVGDENYKKHLPFPPHDSTMAKLIIGQVNNAWFKNFTQNNPAEYWVRVTCPVLALNGTKDLQVDADINLNAIEESLKKAKNKQYKIVRLNNVNHLFQEAKTGAIDEYTQKTDTPTKETLKIIVDWVLEVVK
jgi:alpha/beta superfamily hydrolase